MRTHTSPTRPDETAPRAGAGYAHRIHPKRVGMLPRPGRLLALSLLLVLPAAVSAQTAEPHADAHVHQASGGEAGTALPLRDDLGEYARPVSIRSPRARAWFDQGLRYQYAFNHEEAIASYEAALAIEPDCAICWWGIALAAGPNINAGLTEEGGELALRAVRAATGLTDDLSPVERDLIQALSQRYGAPPLEARAERDRAYADAMARLADRYDRDPDVLTLYGAALMNLNPWNYWSGPYGDRTPHEGTPGILEVLERALEIEPEHPGACHYYIHAVEAGAPERAVPCAERLADLMPGAGHIVHMPGHIYIRVGRYADAVAANEHAVHSDESHFEDVGTGNLYAGTYYPHNYHFMAFAATMAGMSEVALEAARTVAPKVPEEVARDFYWIQNAVVLPQLTNLTFGRWEAVLDEPSPSPRLEQASIMSRYARGVALAGLGRFEEAQDVLEELRARIPQGVDPASNPVPFIAPEALAGEIAMRSGDAATAVTHFRRAADLEDQLLYDEPPLWYYPIRHALGRAQLEAGRPGDAEATYREDLDRFPENGWSLHGLAASLEAQGKTDEAEEVRRRFREAWADADVELPGSRY